MAPSRPIGDGSRWVIDDLFQWNGEGQPPDWCTPGEGSLTYYVMWVDDDYLLQSCIFFGRRWFW
jgi:hypothetical protein